MANLGDRTIWAGDNLDILRGLNPALVDLIHSDPPFNSNRNYAAPVGSAATGAAFMDTRTLPDPDVACREIKAQRKWSVALTTTAGTWSPTTSRSSLGLHQVQYSTGTPRGTGPSRILEWTGD